MNNRVIRCIFVAATALLILSVSGCKTSKTGSSAKYKPTGDIEARYSQIIESYTPWSTFSCPARATITIGKSLSSSTLIRMERDKYISISVRPFLGIEVMRVYMNTDSAFIIDKTHKAVTAFALSQITASIPVSIGDLQDMLITRALFHGKASLSELPELTAEQDTESGNLTFKNVQTDAPISYGFTFNADNNLEKAEFITSGGTQLDVAYKAFTATGAKAARYIILSTVIGKTDATLTVDYDLTKVQWDTPLSDNNDIPASYARLSFKEFMKLW